MSDELKHYGTPRHSGRYPWGSGNDSYQRHSSFIGNLESLRKSGMSDVDIAKGWDMNTSQLRKRIAIATSEKRSYEASEAIRLKDKGYSTSAIARRMGKNESTVRGLLNEELRLRNDKTKVNAAIIKDAVDKHGYIDVGAGVEQHMGISSDKLRVAVALLERDGYQVHPVLVEQLGTGKDTTIKVLTKPGTTWVDAQKHKYDIKLVNGYSEDGGKTLRPFEPPKSVDSKRVKIKYAEEGGDQKDGLIELRRGVDDISLNNAKYAQVRIAVDGTHYIKGMATYGDGLPKGVDIVFNTNKHLGTPMLGESDKTVFKPMKNDPDNPFGATVKPDEKLLRAQRHYIDKDGKEQLSALNVVYEEGDWSRWKRSLASQMMSKQNPALAKQQLDLAHSLAKEEFDEIMSLTNPTVKASLLDKFADQCDSDAVHMQAAALPRQSTKVILPFPDMSPAEIYAPNYKDGETVVLIRYPHGGTFEIPTLTVNNKHQGARATIENAIDAVGINAKVAERLSGADFDGDSVIVIPVDNVNIRTSPRLKGLIDFDAKSEYKHYEGMHRMTSHETQVEMGKVSNLITDMTIKGATSDEICQAVRHSMVVIDAEKHYLDYRRSEKDHRISDLKQKYQGRSDAGSATLLSKAKSPMVIDQRKEKAPSKMTPEEYKAWREGKLIYEDTGKTYSKGRTLKSGEVRYREQNRKEETPRMMETDDAFTLVSTGSKATTTRIESVYANHANAMKALALAARKEARKDEDVPYSPSARKTYAKEYASLDAKLKLALRNAPLERQAQLLANKTVITKRRDNPDLDNEHLKRMKGIELDASRKRVGAGKETINISDKEWEAINAGAVHKTFLRRVLNNADPKRVKELATPRTSTGLSTGKIARAQSMLSSGYTQADVAEALGVSVSTLIKSVSTNGT